MNTLFRFCQQMIGISLVVLIFGSTAWAAAPATTTTFQDPSTPQVIEMFTRDDCQHCADEKAWLTELLTTRSDIAVIYHNLKDPVARQRFDRVAELAALSQSTPITFVGGAVVQGFGTPETTGTLILEYLERAKGKKVATLAEYLAGNGNAVVTKGGAVCDEDGCILPDSAYLVNAPFFGALNVREYSLPAMASILGFIDGFNPCAMWVLVTFLIALVQIGDKRKMWTVAGLFILAETVMYYAILNVWFTTWDFVGLDVWVTPLVGLLAVGSGIFFLYEGITTDGTCKVTNLEQRKKIHTKIKDIVARPFTIGIAIAVIGLALSVNIIEFACSIGIPQAFTKILQINDLTWLSKQALMLIYIFFYMMDDFIVFGLALWSFDRIHLAQQYSKATNILGGVLMLLLGALLILFPEWLKFV